MTYQDFTSGVASGVATFTLKLVMTWFNPPGLQGRVAAGRPAIERLGSQPKINPPPVTKQLEVKLKPRGATKTRLVGVVCCGSINNETSISAIGGLLGAVTFISIPDTRLKPSSMPSLVFVGNGPPSEVSTRHVSKGAPTGVTTCKTMRYRLSDCNFDFNSTTSRPSLADITSEGMTAVVWESVNEKP